MATIVNLFGGPGCGKSTLAARLYSELKQKHVEVEYVNEYPKQLVYEEQALALQNQILVFATQYHRIWTAGRHNQVVITDSPLLLSTVYNPDTSVHLHNLVIETHHKFTNVNILLTRVPQFHSMTGRIHTLEESNILDDKISSILHTVESDILRYNPLTDSLEALVQLIRLETVYEF